MEKINCRLTVLSPLHINWQEVNNMEFYYDQFSLCHVSEARMAQVLKEEGLVEHFINFMSSGKGSLQEYLETHSPAGVKEKLGGRKLFLDTPSGGRINSFYAFQQDPLAGKPYIPGSSIKGALRNDLLLLLLDQKKLSANDLEKAVKNADRRSRHRAGNIVNRLLESANFDTRQGPHKDWLRAIKVSDAFCQEKEPSSIQEVKVASLNKNGSGYHWGAKKTTLHVETINAGTVFTFTIEIDKTLLAMMAGKNKPLVDPESIFQNPTKMNYLATAERRFWEQAELSLMNKRIEQHLSSGANFRLGWGSGYLSTSIGAFLSDQLRLSIGKNVYNTRYPVFPNSRKVVVEENTPVDTLGWCKLERT